MSSQDPNQWMWQRAAELLERADRAQRQFFQWSPNARRPAWEPPIDVFESETEVCVLVALPGVSADDVEVVIERGGLIVRARRTLPAEFGETTVQRLEIPQGHFERRIVLAPHGYVLLEQRLLDGCLRLRLVKEH